MRDGACRPGALDTRTCVIGADRAPEKRGIGLSSAVLTRDEETTLAERVALGDASARDEFVRKNQGLVYKIARKFAGRGIEVEDLAQEGQLGLLRAVEKFRPEAGTKFSTYATHWISSFIRRAIVNHSKAVRVPCHLYDPVSTWFRTEKDLEGRLARPPTTEEVATVTGFDPEWLMPAVRACRGALSLHAPTGKHKDEGGAVIDLLPSSAEPFEEQAGVERSDLVRNALSQLPERERFVVSHRFGLVPGDGRRWLLEELGELMGLSRERVRQLEQRALVALTASLSHLRERRAPRAPRPRRSKDKTAPVAPRRTRVSTIAPEKVVRRRQDGRQCPVNGCTLRGTHARGLCMQHYNRAWRHVNAGRGTWDAIEAAGFAAIADEKPRGPAPAETTHKSSPPPSSVEEAKTTSKKRPASSPRRRVTFVVVEIMCAQCGKNARRRAGSRFCSDGCRWKFRDGPARGRAAVTPPASQAPSPEPTPDKSEAPATSEPVVLALLTCTEALKPLSPKMRGLVFEFLKERFGAA